ncbi:hypothetical protein [Burkholderia cepacia]|uniref:Prolyl oligopeptidase family protein n=1 Tax=Burkholderia cepacia GG4 TaxID=1009846 RepID=A0A9W3P9A4_BURCE|nr:hypothetical protein [Burkholderia cepacia]AFQ48281.1 hypothetical protein GEM_1857 [Burkholderia cepacia GG4]
MNINKIEATHNSGAVRFETFCDQPADGAPEYAYYVYRNGEKIHVEWYKESPVFEYNHNGVDGFYHAAGFVKDSAGSIIQKSSNPLFLNPRVLTGGISQEPASSQALLFQSDEWEVPALYYPHAENRLFVLTPSAVNRASYTLPSFHRFSWAARGLFPGKVLCFSDPMLDLHSKLEIGWCVGTHESDLADVLAKLILDTAQSLGVPQEHIVTWGSSAGGFAALALSSRIEGSTAVAINPQIDALKYLNTAQVELFKTVAFAGISEDEIRSEHIDRIDMLERKRNSKPFRSVLIQNIHDEHHFEIHAKPFWNALGGNVMDGWSECGNDLAYFYRDSGGHVPETEEMLADIVGKCFPVTA